MNETQQKVLEEHIQYTSAYSKVPTLGSLATRILRVKLINEEAGEFQKASGLEFIDGKWTQVRAPNLMLIADAIGDLLVVVYGAAVAFGLDMEPIFNEVHLSNMSKLGEDGKPLLREDGKFLKGPNYFPPDIHHQLALQAYPHKLHVCTHCGMPGSAEEVSVHYRLGCDAL